MKGIATVQQQRTLPERTRDSYVVHVIGESHTPGEPPTELVRAIAHAPPSQLTHITTCVLLI